MVRLLSLETSPELLQLHSSHSGHLPVLSPLFSMFNLVFISVFSPFFNLVFYLIMTKIAELGPVVKYLDL